tara:strand:+ start:295 stop:879 length:585 start_codon:yes stop_codon:yes gene_type:complete
MSSSKETNESGKTIINVVQNSKPDISKKSDSLDEDVDKMTKGQYRKLKRESNRIFARVDSIIDIVLLSILLSIIILILLKRKDVIIPVTYLIAVILFVQKFISSSRNLDVLFTKDSIYEFGNMSIAALNMLLLFIIIFIISFVFIINLLNKKVFKESNLIIKNLDNNTEVLTEEIKNQLFELNNNLSKLSNCKK